ncbi:transglutaminaseTgpA domain-containing protein [Acinetobacter nematophilus]|uniref:transglutaminase family protein n=1 Tax=Acinetobacter nematophilus TaxID=2994642 RepID=UPI003AF4941A
MNKSIQISILVALSLIWLAQLAYMPIALSILFLVNLLGLGWYYQKINAHQTFNIPRVLFQAPKLLFAFFALLIIYLDTQTFLGVEAGTAVLSTFLFAKALETKSKRDFIILFNFALFVSASLFLHSQSFAMAVLVLCCLISCLVGLYRVQTADFEIAQPVLQSLKNDSLHILKFIGLALPFFILLFLFFPRLPPLWQIPIPNHQAVTGLSDRMSPGDIASLSQSSTLAFRIIGDMKQFPNRNELYWRAMVLDHYDGTTWTSESSNKQSKSYSKITGQQDGFHYQYLAGDPAQQWITGLEKSIPIEQRLELHQDWSITPKQLVQRVQPVKLQWIGSRVQDVQVPAFEQWMLKNNLKYPKNRDLQAQKFALAMFHQSQENPDTYIQNILNWYKKENFVYTLAPGKLGNHRIDEFLFQSRQGFCEHYASSFVLLMRYVGIPARVVTGYQGGELAPDGKSWEVRQLDAHAWAEVYQQGQWHRIDPTAIIAPMRIDQGMQTTIEGNAAIFGDGAYSNIRFQHSSILRTLRVWSDYASFQWQSKVVGYDAEKQSGWMKKLGLTSVYSYGLVLILGIIGLLMVYWGVTKLFRVKQMSELERLIFKFNRQLSKDDQKVESETFQQWMSRLASRVEEKKSFEQANKVFQKMTYLDNENQQDIQEIKKLLKECSNALKAGK